MPLEERIQFRKNSRHNYFIKFNTPILINQFSIKAKDFIYYNILVNSYYLIYFADHEQYFDEDYDDNGNFIPLEDNCIKTDFDKIDGYHNNFKFDKPLYIDVIELENLSPDFEQFPDIFLEYDSDHLETNSNELEQEFFDSYCFTKKYFKFFNIPDDMEIDLKEIIDLKVTYKKTGNRTYQRNIIDQETYKFKHLKNNTYYVEFDDEQFKKLDYLYNFNYSNYITSYFPII
jgi:hypothetical protein